MVRRAGMAPMLPRPAVAHPLALAPLPRRERISLAGEGIVVGTKLQAHRRAVEAVSPTEHVHEIAPVGVRYVRSLVAVDHDDGRIAAPLVGVTQLDASPAYQRWLVLLERGFERARELGRRDLAHRRLVGRMHRMHQFTDAGAMTRRDEMHRREVRETQALLQLLA